MLSGVRVLDLTRLLPGPFCSLLLADYGAEVIKIEDPVQGDALRDFPPRVGETGAYYAALNQGKRSMTLDLKDSAARDAFLKLCESADVVLEGFRPGVATRLGVGPEQVRAHHPRMVYASLSGFGQTGPWRDRPGHDLTYLALSGALSQLLPPGKPATLPGLQVADQAGAMYAAFAIMMALWRRERTGQGATLDVAMLDGALSWLPFAASRAQAQGMASPPGTTELTGALARYGVYLAADGGRVALAALEDKFWRAFCQAADHPEWLEERSEPRLQAAVAAFFAAQPRAHWEAWALERDLCLEPVLELHEALRHPQIVARGLPRAGRIGPAVPWPGAGAETMVAPRGADTERILASLGLDEAEIRRWRQRGAI